MIGAPIKEVKDSFPNYWKVCVIPCCIIPMIRLVTLVITRPLDTPSYYILINDEEKAKESLLTVYKPEALDSLYQEQFATMNDRDNTKSPEEHKALGKSEVTITSLLKTDPHYKIVLLGIWIFFC